MQQTMPGLQPWYTRNPRLLILGAALVLGGVCTLIAWPGVFYSDSYSRWFYARNLAQGNWQQLDNWLSVPPQLFMAAIYKLTGSFAAYTWLQASLFFYAVFRAVFAFCPRGKLAICLLFAALPVFYGYSVYLEMSVGCVTALLLLAVRLFTLDAGIWRQKRLPARLWFYATCAFLYFCIFGFRQNAFTVLPVLLFAAWRTGQRCGIRFFMLRQGALALATLLLIAALPWMLHFGTRSSTGNMMVGFVWENVSMVQGLEGDLNYAHMLDYISGPEAAAALKSNNYNNCNGFAVHITFEDMRRPDVQRSVLHDYMRLAFEQPGTFAKVKMRFWGRTLGITHPLGNYEYQDDWGGYMVDYGVRNTAARRGFIASFHGFTDAARIFYRPWVWYFTGAVLLWLARRRGSGEQRRNLKMLYACAVFYYAAFLVTTQSQELRYFFPALVLLFIVVAGAVGLLAGPKRPGDENARKTGQQEDAEAAPHHPKEEPSREL